MAYNPAEALREAGILSGTMSAKVEEFYASLTQEETETLVSVTDRLKTVLPDVVAHDQDWTKPEASPDGLDAALLCACGAWSGSGASAK